MDYLLLKTLHIVSSTFLWGTGVGTAFFMLVAHLNGDASAIRVTTRTVVYADWLFTTPTIIIQPVTGILLMNQMQFPMTSTWFYVVVGLYALMTICWLPVVYLQYRMKLATEGLVTGDLLPPVYYRCMRWWVTLGVPAAVAMVSLFFLMVYKPWIAG